MENPYESLPMGTDSCDGIKDICEKITKLMGDKLLKKRIINWEIK